MKSMFSIYGRLFQTEAFPSDDEANAFMNQNADWGLIGIDTASGLRHVARFADKGEELAPPVSLRCCCCGGSTTGRQWHNQDLGFGLGDCCVEYVKPRVDSDMTRTYGHAGIHYNVSAAPA